MLRVGLAVAAVAAATLSVCGCQHRPLATVAPADVFDRQVARLRAAFPKHFLTDAVISCTDEIERPRSFGEPDPPEGFAGPDPDGRFAFGIYVPDNYGDFFTGDDISVYQWVFHEMFHLHNRRHHDYDRFIDLAFPDESDPLVQWIMQDPYHRTFAREEAFINLVTFADPARTEDQHRAVREFFDYVGADEMSLGEIKALLRVIEH